MFDGLIQKSLLILLSTLVVRRVGGVILYRGVTSRVGLSGDVSGLYVVRVRIGRYRDDVLSSLDGVM